LACSPTHAATIAVSITERTALAIRRISLSSPCAEPSRRHRGTPDSRRSTPPHYYATKYICVNIMGLGCGVNCPSSRSVIALSRLRPVSKLDGGGAAVTARADGKCSLTTTGISPALICGFNPRLEDTKWPPSRARRKRNSVIMEGRRLQLPGRRRCWKCSSNSGC